MPKNQPRRCKGGKPGHGKWAATGSDYCTLHGRKIPQIRVSDIEAGSISVLKIDLKTGEQWGETIYADGRVERTARIKPASKPADPRS